MSVTRSFELKGNGKNLTLLYNDKVLIKGCDEIIELMSNLALTTPPLIEELDISEQEEIELEKMLSNEILNNNKCFDTDEFNMGGDFYDYLD